MDKLKQILILFFQIIALFLLLSSLSSGGVSELLGSTFGEASKIIIQFGIAIMALFSGALSFLLPTRRHRILRDTQIHITKYIGMLGLFQGIAYFLAPVFSTVTIGFSGGADSILMSVIVMMYCMFAFMEPVNYFKNLFSLVKSVEMRDPRKVVGHFFK